jgi:hypothetical protein
MQQSRREDIERSIATNRLGHALDALAEFVCGQDAELANEVTALRGRLSAVERDERRGTLERGEAYRIRTTIRFAALDLLNAAAKIESDSLASAPSIFISYHHGDRDVARRLADLLRGRGVRVIVDMDSMRAGEDIDVSLRPRSARAI